MIVDASAIIAILRAESDAARYASALAASSVNLMSAANYLEAAIVVDRAKDPIASRRLDEVLATANVEIVAVAPVHARIAREAYRDFGKGSGHPAQLNFGDCIAYALAKERGEHLLFKGDDFTKTDIRSATAR